MERTSRINLRVTPAEKEAWEKAANGSVSTWLRDLANHAASEWSPEWDKSLGRALAQVKNPKNSTAQCPRWMHHRPGVYCGSCGK